MKKSKFFKTLGFASLAIFMGATGIFAFAPLGASASVAGASVVDQVNTKADGENIKYAPSPLGLDPENDPVIYTTESGLEIKFGGATTALGGGNETTDFAETLPSGKPLSGYPYFTMGTYSGYAVNWVIIGKSTTGLPTTTTSIGNIDYNYEKLSAWQGQTTVSPTYKHFFENTYEVTTPAGSAIKNGGLLNNYTARKVECMFNPSILSSVVSNAEIPSGCVLTIAEKAFALHQFNSSKNANYQGSTLQTTMQALWSSSLGLNTNQKNLIKTQSLTNHGYGYSSSSNNQYFFPLAYHSSSNFKITSYLNQNSLRIASPFSSTNACNWWLRDGGTDPYNTDGIGRGCAVQPDGTITTYGGTLLINDGSKYFRPACVLKIS